MDSSSPAASGSGSTSIPTAASTTIKSLDQLHTHLPPSVPAHYLTHHVVSTLLRKGFSGAEAGALAEIERLLEHHIHSVFSGSRDYARLAGRAQPNAFDVLKARQAVEISSIRRMRRESKRRRPGIKLVTDPTPPSPPRSTTLQDLPPLSSSNAANDDVDRKPDISAEGQSQLGAKGIRPEYGFDGIPHLPPKWTYPDPAVEDVQEDDTPHGQITKRSLDFVKLTASERGDIPAELGVVSYRKHRKRVAGLGT